jgi:hypothetical protein
LAIAQRLSFVIKSVKHLSRLLLQQIFEFQASAEFFVYFAAYKLFLGAEIIE